MYGITIRHTEFNGDAIFRYGDAIMKRRKLFDYVGFVFNVN